MPCALLRWMEGTDVVHPASARCQPTQSLSMMSAKNRDAGEDVDRVVIPGAHARHAEARCDQATAFGVWRRQREMNIRVALGATRG